MVGRTPEGHGDTRATCAAEPLRTSSQRWQVTEGDSTPGLAGWPFTSDGAGGRARRAPIAFL